jgi:hypothetical protein
MPALQSLADQLLSRQLIIAGECSEGFGTLLEALLGDEAPVVTLECALVERLAIGMWRPTLASHRSGR